MKHWKYILFPIFSFLTIVSCVNEDNLLVADSSVVLDFSSGSLSSRAIEDTDLERAVSHLDVFIFIDNGISNDDNDVLFHYERITVSTSQTKVNLGKERTDFDKNNNYWVYVIANSSTDFDPGLATYTLASLKNETQQDVNVHLTGLSASTGTDIPQTFLMSGIAYKLGTQNSEGQVEQENSLGFEPSSPTSIQINDGTSEGETKLKVVLRRAAAKFVLTINKGEKVSFDKTLEGSNAGYYFRQMPFSTRVFANGSTTFEPTLITTPKVYRDDYFKWTDNQIVLTAYAYSHQWNVNSMFEEGTSLVLDIPLTYKISETQSTEHPKNLYQVFLRQADNDGNFTIARNTYYPVSITVNAPGASEDEFVQTLDATYYAAEPWVEKAVEVGGTNRPKYLQVNKDVLRIYNESVDASSLEFSSSSVLESIIIRQVTNEQDGTPYYINKFGVPTYVGNNIYQTMSVSAPMNALTGKIRVESPVPVNDAVRYFEIILRNKDGLTETVLVEQYPVLYITNVLGYYSYRSDFKQTGGVVTHYEQKGAGYYTVTSWNNNKWTHGIGYDSGFFRSKVTTHTQQTGTNRGHSTLQYYRWAYSSGRNTTVLNTPGTNVYKSYDGKSGAAGKGNARMYHVHVTTTSNQYVVGIPELDNDGYTASTDANKVMVSPSFMIASQLGATSSQNSVNLNRAKTHCKEYVETYINDKGEVIHLDNWRLPTEAEINIILARQYGDGADAMDEVLAGEYYHSATGGVKNTYSQRTGGTGYYVRCVRDAY